MGGPTAPIGAGMGGLEMSLILRIIMIGHSADDLAQLITQDKRSKRR